MHDTIKNTEERMKKSLASLEEGFAGLRTGRASAALFEKIKVDAYGQKTPLKDLATISVPEARLVVIQSWDKNLIGEIEKAIRASELSLNPSNDGKVVRVAIPPLTGERRKELVKQAKSQAEQSKVALRNIRRDAHEDFKKRQKAGEISEDDLSRAEAELQKLTDDYVAKAAKHAEVKEKEIMEV